MPKPAQSEQKAVGEAEPSNLLEERVPDSDEGRGGTMSSRVGEKNGMQSDDGLSPATKNPRNVGE